MNRTACLAAAIFCVRVSASAGPALSSSAAPAERTDPASLWSADFSTGVLWQAGNNTSLDYVILPQIVSLRSPAHIRLSLGEGELTLRARLNLMAQAVVEGPESFYAGASFSPSVEYWFPQRSACLFFSAGGGAGVIDSRGVEGGQGQDFTLNWFAEAGLRWYVRHDLAVSLSCFFQHWSNGGMTDPNPGVDAVGPMIGLTWTF